MNVCSIWPFAQISDDFDCLDIWQCARYFVAALFKELALITIREMLGLESRSRSRNLSQVSVSVSEVTVSTTSLVDTLGYSTKKHQDWFDSNDAEIQKLLYERNTTFAAKLRNPNSAELQRRWALQRSQLQKRLGEMENTWWLSKATEIQNYANANMAHQFYEAIKALYSPKSHSTHPAHAKDGITLVKDKKEILSRWAEHLQELLNQDNPVDQSTPDQLPQLPVISDLDTISSIEEISAAANNLKNNKAPGPDGILAENFKYGGNLLLQ